MLGRGTRSGGTEPRDREALIPLVPPIASRENPVNLTPQSFNDQRYLASLSDALATVALDEGVDILLGLFGPMATGLSGVIEAVTMLHAQTEKMCASCGLWGPKLPMSVCVSVAFMSLPILHLRSLSSRRLWRRPWSRPTLAPVAPRALDWASLVPRAEAGTVLPEHASQRILRAAGLPVSLGVLARSEEELPLLSTRWGCQWR